MPHPRILGAHWPDPWSQEDSQARPPCLPVPPISSFVPTNTALAAQLIRPPLVPSFLINSAAGPAVRVLFLEALPFRFPLNASAPGIRPFAPARPASAVPVPPSAYACLSGANRLTCGNEYRPGRPFAVNLRLLSRIGGSTFGECPIHTMPSPAWYALVNASRSGGQRLRPLAPSLLARAIHQRHLSDLLVWSRPFDPSSLSSKPRLRAERFGGLTHFDLSIGVLGNDVPGLLVSTIRTVGVSHLRGRFTRTKRPSGMHFSPEKCGGGPLPLIFPPFLRGSGPLRREFPFS